MAIHIFSNKNVQSQSRPCCLQKFENPRTKFIHVCGYAIQKCPSQHIRVIFVLNMPKLKKKKKLD